MRRSSNPEWRNWEKTLRAISDVIIKIEELNKQLNRPADQNETQDLKPPIEEGKDLVCKCLHVRKWNVLKKSSYHKKLVKLHNKILRFHIFLVQAHTLLEVKTINLNINNLTSFLQRRIMPTHILSDLPSPQVVRPKCSGLRDGDDVAGIQVPLLVKSQSSELHESGVVIEETVISNCSELHGSGVVIEGPYFISDEAEYELSATCCVGICEGLISLSTNIIVAFEKCMSHIWIEIDNAGMLKTTIEQVEHTMESLVPVLHEIEESDKEQVVDGADQSETESIRRLMEEGKELVGECSNMGWWDFLKKWQYQEKLAELDNKLLRFHSIYLQARIAETKNHATTGNGAEINACE